MPTPSRPATRGSVLTLMVALMCAIFAFQLNASMLSPALATMERQLDATAAQIGMTQTAFFASAALFSLFLPRWGDLVGRRRLMVAMLLVTGIGCVISALAPNVAVLGLGRIVQGVAGPIVPMALIMLHVQVPEKPRYAKLMAVLTSVNGGIAGVDALLGGWLAQNFGFRSVFWTMTAVCIVAGIAVLTSTVESRAAERMPMDWKGVAVLVLAFGAVYFAFDEAGRLADARWAMVAALLLVAVLAFVAFWRIETRAAHPLVTTRYLRQRRTWALLGTTLLTMTGVFAVMNGLIPNLAQDVEIGPGISAGQVSLWTLTPYAIAGLVMGPVAGQLASRFGYRAVLQAGLVTTTLALGAAAWASAHPTTVLLLALSIIVGITYAGITNIMLNGLGIVLSPADNQGYLPGMNSGAFNLGAGLSFALLFAVNTVVAGTAGPVAGYRAGILAGAVLLLAALALSTRIPRRRPDAEDGPGTGENGVTATTAVDQEATHV